MKAGEIEWVTSTSHKKASSATMLGTLFMVVSFELDIFDLERIAVLIAALSVIAVTVFVVHINNQN